MATQAALILGVKSIVQDTTFTSTTILDYLNQCQRQIAGGIFFQYPDKTQIISSPLPDLITSSDLETSVSNPYISMPSNYGRNLFFLVSSTNELEIELYESFTELLRIYPNLDDTNRVVAAAVRGNRLYYQGYPSTAEDLVAYYHRIPTDMTTYTASTISFAESGSRISDTASNATTGFGLLSVGQTIDFTGTTSNNTSFVISAIATDYSYITVSTAPTDEAAGDSMTIKSRPDGIPVHLQESLLKDCCVWEILKIKASADPNMEMKANRYHEFFLRDLINMETAIATVPGSVQFMPD